MLKILLSLMLEWDVWLIVFAQVTQEYKYIYTSFSASALIAYAV